MDDNPYESPAEISLPEEHSQPPKPDLALRIKRITQIVTLACAVAFFLVRAGVLPAQDVIVLQLLFGGSMLGLVIIIACNYFIRPRTRRAVTPPRRLRVK